MKEMKVELNSIGRPSAALSHEAIDCESDEIGALEDEDQRSVHAPASKIIGRCWFNGE